MPTAELTETSEQLIEELQQQTGFESYTRHTGGGCMVAVVDLTQDARGLGRQAWLTRDADGWILGFYDFAADEEDEGVCVELVALGDLNSPEYVAAQVAAILKRLGVTLQG